VCSVSGVPDDLLPRAGLAPQLLRLALSVPGDHRVGGGQDGLGRAVVLLEQDRAGRRVVAFELHDVADRRAPERVDRLVGVPHDAQFPAGADQLLDQDVLRVVGVLVLVDEHVPEPVPVLLGDLRPGPQQPDGRHDQIVEVERVRLAQPALVQLVRLGEQALCRAVGPVGERVRVHQLVLEVGDLRRQRPGRIALGVEIELPADQLHEPAGVIGVVDREARLQPGGPVLGAQDPHARRVERRDPHEPGPRADQRGHPLLHLTGGLVGERDRQDLGRVDVVGRQQIRDPVRQDSRLARAGAGHDQQRRPDVGHGGPLPVVEAGQHPIGVAGEQRRGTGGHGLRRLPRPGPTRT
jgi:hypothetical protein